MNNDKIFISPGVYDSETVLQYAASQISVTALGLVAEFQKGPAFNPIYVTDYEDEFVPFFGRCNAEKYLATGYAKYEGAYVAKEYLMESNQMYVVRILGLSGYNAGRSWGITLSATLDPSTSGQTGTTNVASGLIRWTATTDGTITAFSSSTAQITALYTASDATLLPYVNALPLHALGAATAIPPIFYKDGELTNDYVGVSSSLFIITSGSTSSGGITYLTGNTSGITIGYSGTSYSDVENKIVALLRSRATYDGSEVLNFELTGDTIGFSSASTGAATNPLSTFVLTGTAANYGAFSYTCSLDNTSNSFMLNVLGQAAFDKKVAIFIEEDYSGMFNEYIDDGKVRGLHLSLINYSDKFREYREEYSAAYTPYFVSQIDGNKIMKLFRFKSISDGNDANKEIKISIINIKPDDKTFGVQVRSFYDTDAKPVVLEQFLNCNLDENSNYYLGKRIGTVDGNYLQISNYILVEFDTDNDITSAYPCGYMGYVTKDFTSNSNTTVQNPILFYNQSYNTYDNKRKVYLGLSDTTVSEIDQNMFNYNGLTYARVAFTGITHGFHMESGATSITSVDGISVVFDCGTSDLQSESGVINTDYEKVYARKFTACLAGGYDGWDIYRKERTNDDNYIISGTKGILGLRQENFGTHAMDNGDLAITSDYYAYLQALQLLSNPEAQNINILFLAGVNTIDHTNMIEEVISVAEDYRRDCVTPYVTPDVDHDGTQYTEDDIVGLLENQFDTTYGCTFWPFKQYNDTENNTYIWLSPVHDYIRDCAYTDRVSYPWFAAAGVKGRGGIKCVQMRKKLTQDNRDTLYDERINPSLYMPSYGGSGYFLWGNKNLSTEDNLLNRLNTRRLLLQARKLCSVACVQLVFDQDDAVVLSQFLDLVNPILANIQKQRGLTDFRVVAKQTPEDMDQHILRAQLYLKPIPTLEGIFLDFIVTPQGVSFENL